MDKQTTTTLRPSFPHHININRDKIIEYQQKEQLTALTTAQRKQEERLATMIDHVCEVYRTLRELQEWHQRQQQRLEQIKETQEAQCGQIDHILQYLLRRQEEDEDYHHASATIQYTQLFEADLDEFKYLDDMPMEEKNNGNGVDNYSFSCMPQLSSSSSKDIGYESLPATTTTMGDDNDDNEPLDYHDRLSRIPEKELLSSLPTLLKDSVAVLTTDGDVKAGPTPTSSLKVMMSPPNDNSEKEKATSSSSPSSTHTLRTNSRAEEKMNRKGKGKIINNDDSLIDDHHKKEDIDTAKKLHLLLKRKMEYYDYYPFGQYKKRQQ